MTRFFLHDIAIESLFFLRQFTKKTLSILDVHDEFSSSFLLHPLQKAAAAAADLNLSGCFADYVFNEKQTNNSILQIPKDKPG